MSQKKAKGKFVGGGAAAEIRTPILLTLQPQCNQTKDRPCSNCARRYPPVACTYLSHESSSAKGSRFGSLRAYAVKSMFVLTPPGRRGSPSEHSDRGRITPKMDEHMANETIQRGSASPYESLAGAQEYPSLPLEQQPTYPNSPEIYYPSLQPVNYSPQTQFAGSPTFYPAATNGGYLSPQSATTASSGHTYSSYYSPVSTTQSNWSPAVAESRDFIGLSGTYDQINDLPLEPSSLNADLFQFCEPDNPQ